MTNCLQSLLSQETNSALNYAWVLEGPTRNRARKEYVFWIYGVLRALHIRHNDVAENAIWYTDACLPHIGDVCQKQVALACMFLALKVHHDEMTLDDLIKWTEIDCRNSDIKYIESRLLEILEWKLHPPVVSIFIDHIGNFLHLQLEKIEAAHEHWRYICGRKKLLMFKSSVKACATLRFVDDIEISSLAQICLCTEDEIKRCFQNVLIKKRKREEFKS